MSKDIFLWNESCKITMIYHFGGMIYGLCPHDIGTDIIGLSKTAHPYGLQLPQGA